MHMHTQTQLYGSKCIGLLRVPIMTEHIFWGTFDNIPSTSWTLYTYVFFFFRNGNDDSSFHKSTLFSF